MERDIYFDQLDRILDLAGITGTKSRNKVYSRLNNFVDVSEREVFIARMIKKYGLQTEDVIEEIEQPEAAEKDDEKEPPMSEEVIIPEDEQFATAMKRLLGDRVLSEEDKRGLRTYFDANHNLDGFDLSALTPVSEGNEGGEAPAVVNEGGVEGGDPVNPPAPVDEEEAVRLAGLAEFYAKWCESEKFTDGDRKGQQKRNFEQIATEDGSLHFVIKADPELGESGTEIIYLTSKELTVLPYNGKMPGERDYIYFCKDIEAMQNSGSDTIEFGNIKTPEFATKFLGAALEGEMKIENFPKKVSLAPEVLVGMSPETQGKLLTSALLNGCEIQSAPEKLDLNNEVFKDMAPKDKYKVVAVALLSGMKIENGPGKFEMHQKDAEGKYVFDKVEAEADGEKFMGGRYQDNAYMSGLTTDEKAAIRKYNFEQMRAKAAAINDQKLYRKGRDPEEKKQIAAERKRVMDENMTPEQAKHHEEQLQKQFGKVKGFVDTKKDAAASEADKKRAESGLSTIFRTRWKNEGK